MNILIIVAVRDRALNGYMRPFFAQSTGQAIRMFGDEINRVAQDNPLNAHPDDYDLYQLGTYNDQTGQIMDTDTGQPEQLALGKQLKTNTDYKPRYDEYKEDKLKGL